MAFESLPQEGDTPQEFARRARDRELAARERAQKARELAVKDAEHGDLLHARMHEREARHHEDAAEKQRRAAEVHEDRVDQ
jgi:hypothetical protein